jgi:hypothetical protein
LIFKLQKAKLLDFMKEMAESWLSAKDQNKIPFNAAIAKTIKPQNSQQNHHFPLTFGLLVCIYRCCNSQQVITSYEATKLHIEVAPYTSMIYPIHFYFLKIVINNVSKSYQVSCIHIRWKMVYKLLILQCQSQKKKKTSCLICF